MARNAADDPNKRAIHAYLTIDAHDAWHKQAAEVGVSVSALLEAMAEDLPVFLRDEEVIKRARKVDVQRRRRSSRS